MTERAPLGPWQALQEQNRVNRVGGARQLVANASPIPSQQSAVGDALAALAATSDISFKNDDIYTLAAAGAQTKTLTYPPIEQSLHVELNGLKATKGVDWTLSGNVLSLLSPLDCRVGDVLTTEYAYYTGVPATPTDEPTVLFAWNYAADPTTSGSPAWTVANGSYTTGPAGGRFDARSTQYDSACHSHKTVAPQPKLDAGIAINSAAYTDDTDGDDFGLMSFCGDSGATCHIYIGFSANALRVYRGQRGTVLATSTATLTANVWNYVEAEVVVHDTTGYVKVWLDNVQVISFTGDTKNGGTSTNLDTVKVGGFWPNDPNIDDFFIATGFIGDPGDVTSLM